MANWDDALAREGFVDQSVANTDNTDSTIGKSGFDYINFSEITPTPIECYPLHEGSGSTAYNLASTNDGVYSGPILGQSGLLSTTSPEFDGVDDYIDTNNGGSFGSPDFTMMCWVKSSTQQFSRFISNYDGGSADNETAMRFDQNGNGAVIAALNTSDGNYLATGTTNIFDGVWHLVAIVRRGNSLEVWADAVNEDTTTVSGTPSEAVDHWVGGSPNQGGDFFAGKVADVRFYDVALTGQNIQTYYDIVKTNNSWLSTSSVV